MSDTPETPELTVDSLSPEDKDIYAAINADFQSDPASVPEKFRNAENPVLEYMKSYKQLEQKFHQSAPIEANTHPEVPEQPTAVVETDDGDVEVVAFDEPEEPVEDEGDFMAVVQEIARNGQPSEASMKYLREKHNMTDEHIHQFIIPSIQREAQAQVAEALEILGGKENYQKMNAWMQKNKTREEIQATNQLLADPSTRNTVLRGLMAEANISASPTNRLVPTAGDAGTPTAQPFQTNQELQDYLRNPIIRQRYHPDHDQVVAELNARIAATPPGILA